MSSEIKQKYKMVVGIEYDGSNYHGWQKQRGLETVQKSLEIALAKIAAEPVAIVCAGRTDTAVHALSQVAHFETTAKRSTKSWVHGVNSYLPSDIRIIWVKEFPIESDFHARFSATSRYYRYIIYNGNVNSAFLNKKWAFYPFQLDLKAMQKASRHLMGNLDFNAFRGADCQSRTSMRHVKKLTLARLKTNSNVIIMDVVANAFLQHMVRNIAGTLILVGKGVRKPEWVKEVLLSCDRKEAGPTADAAGLYLVQVDYPRKYNLPKHKLNKSLFLL